VQVAGQHERKRREAILATFAETDVVEIRVAQPEPLAQHFARVAITFTVMALLGPAQTTSWSCISSTPICSASLR